MAGHNLATHAFTQFAPKLKADRAKCTARPAKGIVTILVIGNKVILILRKMFVILGPGFQFLVFARSS